MRMLNISSKGVLSYWFRDLKLSPASKQLLRRNTELAYKRGLVAFNARRTEAIRAENQEILAEAGSEIPSLSTKDLLLIGAALYWAEGMKSSSSKPYPTVTFSNSDSLMVKVFMRYLREVLQIPDEQIKPGIILYRGIDMEKAKSFWAGVTRLPKETFWVSVAVSRASKKRRPGNSLPYGTIQLRVNSRQPFFRILWPHRWNY